MEERTQRERIYDAALECFERAGVRRTTMDDVAQAAGVSRPAIYYYYDSKQALIIEVVLRQIAAAHRKVDREVRSRHQGIEAVLAAIWWGIKDASDNPYTKLLTAPDGERLTAAALQSEAAMEVEHAFWGPLLEDARQRGELRTDVGTDELIRLILFAQFSVVTHGTRFGLADGDVRLALRRFLLPALQPGAPG